MLIFIWLKHRRILSSANKLSYSFSNYRIWKVSTTTFSYEKADIILSMWRNWFCLNWDASTHFILLPPHLHAFFSFIANISYSAKQSLVHLIVVCWNKYSSRLKIPYKRGIHHHLYRIIDKFLVIFNVSPPLVIFFQPRRAIAKLRAECGIKVVNANP